MICAKENNLVSITFRLSETDDEKKKRSTETWLKEVKNSIEILSFFSRLGMVELIRKFWMLSVYMASILVSMYDILLS